jgi:ribose transport system permease protein
VTVVVGQTDTSSRRERALTFLGSWGNGIVLMALIAVFVIAAPSTFGTLDNFRNILSQAAAGSLVAFGLTTVLIVGEFDISIGYVASLAGVLFFGLMVHQDLPFPAALILTLAVGAGLGLLSGLIVTGLGVSAFVGTLGVGIIALGLNYLYNGGASVAGETPHIVSQIGLERTFGIPNTVLIAATIGVLLAVYSEGTVPGIRSRAVGGNPQSARLASVNVPRLRILAFVVSGLLATSGGILLSTQLGSGDPTAGNVYLLDAFAAAFLGTGFYRAGAFSIPGTIVGALILQVGYTGLAVLGQPTATRYLFEGVILVFALALGSVVRRGQRGR